MTNDSIRQALEDFVRGLLPEEAGLGAEILYETKVRGNHSGERLVLIRPELRSEAESFKVKQAFARVRCAKSCNAPRDDGSLRWVFHEGEIDIAVSVFGKEESEKLAPLVSAIAVFVLRAFLNDRIVIASSEEAGARWELVLADTIQLADHLLIFSEIKEQKNAELGITHYEINGEVLSIKLP